MVGAGVVVNESGGQGLWQQRSEGCPCLVAALTRTSLSIPGGPRGPISRSQERLPAPPSNQACHEGGAEAGWGRLGWVWGRWWWAAVSGWGLTCREGNYSKDKDYAVISPHSSLMKRAG